MTKQAKHTPGPWEIHDPQGNPQLVTEKNGEQALVADCESVSREAEEDIANARLIAAAPEMAEWMTDFYKFLAQISAGPSTAAFQKRICAVLQKAGVLDGGI